MSLRATFPAFALVALLGGCVEKQAGSIEIYQVCSPPKPDTDGGCLWPTGKCTTSPLGRFWLDVDTATGFYLGFEVHNQLKDNSDPDSGRGDTQTAYVKTSSTSFSGPISLPDSPGPAQITVPSGGSAITTVEVVNGGAMQALYDRLHGTEDVLTIEADIKLKGVWGDQSSFETASRSYQISVCAGCLAADVPTCETGKTLYVCGGDVGGQYPSTYSCGGSGTGTTYTMGGTITGLANGTLVVSCTGLSDLTIDSATSPTTFTFSGSVADGTSYTCSINRTASTTSNNCSFGAGTNTGTVSGGNVTSLRITCTP